MSKRPARRRSRAAAQGADPLGAPLEAPESASNVRRLFEDAGWSPVPADARPAPRSDGAEQKYRRNIRAQSVNQQALLDAIDARPLVFSVGPAGTGKTFLSIAKAVEALERGDVRRIVLARPAVEAGESLGFLPGSFEDKLAPYLRPLYDALCDRLSSKRLKALMAEGVIEIAPLAYMRGRTLNNACVVIDEAQNCTYGQLKMALTRLGWSATMIVNGDPAQTDLLPGMSGLADIVERLEPLESVAVVRFDRADVVRHPVVREVVDRL